MAIQPKSVVGEPCPYLGLRPFFEKDAKWFFGRGEQTDDLLRMLGRKRFLAVTGTSGSGKSSLVRAGLIPSLKRGYMPGSTARWRVAVSRPRGNPFSELEAALTEALGIEAGSGAALRASSLGLVEVAAKSLGERESLLVVIDQFEEIFRFKNESDATGDESDAFVKLLLAAAEQAESRVYIVLTMRSDYLGDCSVFRGLPEALNGSQYLAPVLSRAQLREAIERPAQARGVEIAPELSQRLLNDVGHGLEQELDQLPVLQHALMRTWQKAEGEERLEMRHYQAAGRMSGALDQHADELYYALSEPRRELARKLFQRLTEKEAQGRDIRRATSFGELVRLMDAPRAETLAVVEHFQGFLATAEPGEMRDESIVDITHEALIRQWRRLRGWAQEEAEMARVYRRLADDASHADAEPWRGARLLDAVSLSQDEGWNQTWAQRYAAAGKGGEEYQSVERFLQSGIRERRKLSLIRWAGAAAVLLFAAFAYWYYFDQQRERIETRAAVEQQRAEREAAEARLAAAIDQLHESESLIQELESVVADLDELKAEARRRNDRATEEALARQQEELEQKIKNRKDASQTYQGSVEQIGREIEKIRAQPTRAIQQLAPQLLKQGK